MCTLLYTLIRLTSAQAKEINEQFICALLMHSQVWRNVLMLEVLFWRVSAVLKGLRCNTQRIPRLWITVRVWNVFAFSDQSPLIKCRHIVPPWILTVSKTKVYFTKSFFCTDFFFKIFSFFVIWVRHISTLSQSIVMPALALSWQKTGMLLCRAVTVQETSCKIWKEWCPQLQTKTKNEEIKPQFDSERLPEHILRGGGGELGSARL